MHRRIPSDAFDFYVSLDTKRSYRAVAEHYGVSKRAVTKCAGREKWSERLARIESTAREKSDQRLAETIEDMRTRHLKTIRAMSARALRALSEYPLTTGMDGMRAAELAIKLERLVAGEATDRTATVEETVRRESERWLEVAESDADKAED